LEKPILSQVVVGPHWPITGVHVTAVADGLVVVGVVVVGDELGRAVVGLSLGVDVVGDLLGLAVDGVDSWESLWVWMSWEIGLGVQ
jgi:hypothetical protein